jgi:hypothetical protein
MTNTSSPNELPTEPAASEELVKSKQRVADHGEVFTPSWMVEDMLDLVKSESERIDSRFLEPACGSGNFLRAVLTRKLRAVDTRYKKSEFERRHYALLALTSIYGIELLADNVEECRKNLLDIFIEFLGATDTKVFADAAANILRANIIHGDALSLETTSGDPIEFPEWGYLGRGKFQRRDFRFDALTQRASFEGTSFEGTLFEMREEHELFIPTKTYAPMTVEEIAQ